MDEYETLRKKLVDVLREISYDKLKNKGEIKNTTLIEKRESIMKEIAQYKLREIGGEKYDKHKRK